MSLDGYIAGPEGQTDWIEIEPELNVKPMLSEFDTILMGRRTFEVMAAAGSTSMPGKRMVVFSRTLRQEDHPEITIVAAAERATVNALKGGDGKDILLYGGGMLFASLLEAGVVDTVEVTVMPILLGGGIPLLPASPSQVKLSLTRHGVYEGGLASLEYVID
jgi:dihydrofolate reductase